LPEKKKAHFHQIGDFLPEWGVSTGNAQVILDQSGIAACPRCISIIAREGPSERANSAKRAENLLVKRRALVLYIAPIILYLSR
jgi:hypothetical protein